MDALLSSLLLYIAQMCIDNNWHRTAELGSFHYFTQAELRDFNERFPGEPKLDGGYVFLDKDGGTEGMIRLYSDGCNPKWAFWMEDGVLKVDWTRPLHSKM
jgi:hypothetical protein